MAVTDRAPSATAHGSARGGPRPRGSRALGLLVLGFVLATASLVGSTLYANARLEAVAQRSHAVSDNAMPSVMALGAMRRHLAHIELLLQESSEGDPAAMRDIPGCWTAFEEEQRRYRALPEFPGEAELWDAARARIDDVRRIASSIGDRVASRDLRAAKARAHEGLQPAVRAADGALAGLIALNHDQGRRAADEADAAWTHLRRLSIVLDLLCAFATAGLALAAYLGFRKYASATRQRAAELEAFAARVAHDVRGPLTPALVALELVARKPGADGDVRQRSAERGLRSLRRVEDLVSDLLAFARSAANPEPNAFASLGSVVSGVVQDLEADASAARIALRVEELPACEVACAPGVLTSIVLNLVSNAIKHFPDNREPRRVTISATVHAGRVYVEVADTGAGLPPDAQRRIFEPHVRIDVRRPGLGLGLATVRRLVESHGGAVGVRSRPGEGAVFWFVLPQREGASR
jgi:signal transduction histidine kinase